MTKNPYIIFLLKTFMNIYSGWNSPEFSLERWQNFSFSPLKYMCMQSGLYWHIAFLSLENTELYERDINPSPEQYGWNLVSKLSNNHNQAAKTARKLSGSIFIFHSYIPVSSIL